MKTKHKILIVLAALVILIGASIVTFCIWAVSVPTHPVDPKLRASLEQTYASFLEALDREDPMLLMSVLTANRMKMYDEILRENGKGTFPNDYFRAFKPIMPNMPPTTNFQFVAMTKSEKHANLIYIGNMKGYLRKTLDDRRFLIVQFQKENDRWKYLVVTDPSANIIPNVDERIRKKQLYFLKMKPFTADEIPLLPRK